MFSRIFRTKPKPEDLEAISDFLRESDEQADRVKKNKSMVEENIERGARIKPKQRAV